MLIVYSDIILASLENAFWNNHTSMNRKVWMFLEKNDSKKTYRKKILYEFFPNASWELIEDLVNFMETSNIV